jgi:hypothetical protein
MSFMFDIAAGDPGHNDPGSKTGILSAGLLVVNSQLPETKTDYQEAEINLLLTSRKLAHLRPTIGKLWVGSVLESA